MGARPSLEQRASWQGKDQGLPHPRPSQRGLSDRTAGRETISAL